jgi:hypothetical protein
MYLLHFCTQGELHEHLARFDVICSQYLIYLLQTALGPGVTNIRYILFTILHW